ncbi:MAG TPA: hypothetical protein VFA26_02075, partial [Gemmataceae bacterium]|nr:hypothetical protein [Gemmataceae bacterium]
MLKAWYCNKRRVVPDGSARTSRPRHRLPAAVSHVPAQADQQQAMIDRIEAVGRVEMDRPGEGKRGARPRGQQPKRRRQRRRHRP